MLELKFEKLSVMYLNVLERKNCFFAGSEDADTDGWTEDDWKQLLPWKSKSRLLNHRVSGWLPGDPKLTDN